MAIITLLTDARILEMFYNWENICLWQRISYPYRLFGSLRATGKGVSVLFDLLLKVSYHLADLYLITKIVIEIRHVFDLGQVDK